MRYQLRTLLILMAIGPPMLAWWLWPLGKAQYDGWRSRHAVRAVRHLRPDGFGVVLISDDEQPAPEGGGLTEVPVAE